MNITLEGKNALVCGSSQGIGESIARQLAESGCNVTLLARNEDKLKNVLASLNVSGTQKHGLLVADFSNPTHLEETLAKHIKSSGIKYHILINNTGGPAAGKAIDAKTQQFIDAFQMHLICNHILVSNVVEGMKANNYGRIINIISTSVKQPLKNLGVSNTIRGAVANWSKTLATELAPFGITVNNVLPGATKTTRLEAIITNKSNSSSRSKEEVSEEMLAEIPAKRFGEAHEIAAAAVFLCSPQAAYINGINLPVDGGRTTCL